MPKYSAYNALGADVSGDEIVLASQAQGDIMYHNGTKWVRLAKGAAAEMLAINSGATAPEWITGVATTDLSKLVLMKSGSGSTTSTSEVELDIHTFAVNDFAALDNMVIVLRIDDKSSVSRGVTLIRVTDGSGDVDQDLVTIKDRMINHNIEIIQKVVAPQVLGGINHRIDQDGGNVAILKQWVMTDSPIIPTAFTMSLRGNVNTGGTLYWKWWIYKRDHE